MLHDTVEDTNASITDIKSVFGEDVADLVDGVTKLGGIRFSSREEKQAGNFMKMLLSVAQDLRVIIIKFADRLHNMKTIKHLPRMKRHRIAMETRDVYVPLANRLGMAKVKADLEDLVFQTLNPKSYSDLESLGVNKEMKLRFVNSSMKKYLKRHRESLI